MPLTSDVEVSDDIIVNFDESTENKRFAVTLSNKGKNSVKVKRIGISLDCINVINFNEESAMIRHDDEKIYFFEAKFAPAMNSNEGKIRFSFNNHTHVTRSIRIVHGKMKQSVNAKISNGPRKMKKNEHEHFMANKHHKNEVKRPEPIEISDDLKISFDRSQKNQILTVKLRNNRWKAVHLKTIEISEPVLNLCGALIEGTVIQPRGELELDFEAVFVPNQYCRSAGIRFDFGSMTIRRTVFIEYQTRGPTIQKDLYETPIELVDLIAKEYRTTKSRLCDSLDEWIPAMDVDYPKNFHSLYYLEEIGLRKEMKDAYAQKEAFFGDQETTQENGRIVRRKYEKGIYDLTVKDLYEMRPSLQIGKE